MAARKFKTNEILRPDIYKYHEYRVFLKDWLDFLKSSQPDFSTRQLSAKSGIAVGYLNMVIKGSRNLSEKVIYKMLPYLGLVSTEAEYLSALVRLSDSKTQQTRLHALSKMQTLHSSREKPKELEVHKYLSKWHYVAIREMVTLPGFKLQPDWISQRLQKPVTLKEISEAIQFLKSADFIREMTDGSVVQTQKQLDCFSGIYRLSLAEFHKQMVSLAAESIDNVPREDRNILGHTFAVDEKSFEKVKSLLDQLQRSLIELEAESSGRTRVYHVEMLAFPLTKKVAGRDE